jgi:hypothetical protein
MNQGDYRDSSYWKGQTKKQTDKQHERLLRKKGMKKEGECDKCQRKHIKIKIKENINTSTNININTPSRTNR